MYFISHRRRVVASHPMGWQLDLSSGLNQSLLINLCIDVDNK